MIARVLLAVLAVDGGTVDSGTLSAPGRTPDFGAELYSECNERWPADAGAAVQQPGGAWLYPAARNARVACLLATCDVDRQDRARETPLLSTGAAVAIMVSAGLGLLLGGGLVGWAVWQIRPLFP